MLGVMVDCSRNAVLNVETVKRFAEIISKMGYNTMMLYTEDTFEIEGQPFFGHLRGRYSKAELKEMNEYCTGVGVELIPCIQTLAHLNAMFKWMDEYENIKDCDDILLAGEEKTYALIEGMFRTFAECFSTKKIHIGMDEAYRVGTGKYRQKHGEEDGFDIINNHLHKVCEIAEKYGFETMVWSDMFCKLALNLRCQYDNAEDVSMIKDKAKLPENVSLVYWDYYSQDCEHYAKQIQINALFDRKVVFAGGAWTWRGFAPANEFSMSRMEPAIKACADNGVDDMIFTMWGDDGNECSIFAVLPALMFAAEVSRGNNDMDSIKARFMDITGCDFDSFMLLDKMDEPGGSYEADNVSVHCPCKYILYNDPFMGIRDYLCEESVYEYYNDLADKLRRAKSVGEFGYLFDSYAALAEVDALKGDLGVRARKAYLEKNMGEIKSIICDYKIVAEKVKAFHKAHQFRWFKENKPHGFDIQDIRLGGVIQRLESCRIRLELLVDGEIESIPELDEPVLRGRSGWGNYWYRCVSPNIIGHVLD